MKKALVVYYSWSNGNTRRIAQQLRRQFGDVAVPHIALDGKQIF